MMVHGIGTMDAGAGPKGICSCGWMGAPRESNADALEDARRHAAARPLSTDEGQRLLLLRENARTRQGSPTWSDVDFVLTLFDRLRRSEKVP